MSQYIQSILESEENILWEGKQEFWPTVFSSLLTVLFLMGFAWVFGLAGGSSTGTCTINGRPAPLEECNKIMTWVSYGIYAVAVLIPVFKILNYFVTKYAITNKRLLIKSGIIGADMRSVYYDQVRSAFVNVGLIGKIFGTGSVLIDTGRITQSRNGRHGGSSSKPDYDRFSNIAKPYEIYKLVQEQLSSNKEALHSGRSDYENNTDKYKDFVKGVEQAKKDV